MSSTAKAEYGGIFHNCVVAIAIRNTLEGMGHLQGHTKVNAHNSIATSFIHSSMREQRSKSWDMEYNWLHDRQAQNQFEITWQKRSTNQRIILRNIIHQAIIRQNAMITIYEDTSLCLRFDNIGSFYFLFYALCLFHVSHF